MRKIKKINGFLVVKFNDREKREYGGTPEDRDATAILLTLPMGLVALFTEIPERGKRTKRD